jgi:hypothetical protein
MIDYSLLFELHNSIYHITKGKILNKLNQKDKAIVSFKPALEYNPANSEPGNSSGNVLINREFKF